MIQVTVNGEPRGLPDAQTVAQLLQSLALTRGRVAVEINTEVVPRATYGERTIRAGDAIEVVTFVGGGV